MLFSFYSPNYLLCSCFVLNIICSVHFRAGPKEVYVISGGICYGGGIMVYVRYISLYVA